ncbi:extracellular solute-binding protein [candidate division KSB1 bacterium]|nr:extracellular solute-binding protein [candidate division KSB1 bacterium]
MLHAQDRLVLLSPHWEGVKIEFTRAFQRDYQSRTGRSIELKWLDIGGSADILRFIRSEFKTKPDGIGVDLFFGGGIEPYTLLKELKLLEAYRLPMDIFKKLAPAINGVPLYDPDYTWYAVTMAGFGVIYNKPVLRRLKLPVPQSWDDLTQPEIFSWIGMADPRKSGSVHMAFEIILQAYGWERGWQILTAMSANIRSFTTYGAQTPKDVALGEIAYGLSIDSYAWAQIKEYGADRIGFIMPPDLTVVSGDAIAILKGAEHRAAAQEFINFVLAETGQKLLLLRQGEPDGPQEYELAKFSILPGLYPQVQGRTSVQLNPFDWHSNFQYDAGKGSARWGLMNDLVGSLLIEPNKELKAAWRKAIRQGTARRDLPKLAQVPISESGLAALATTTAWNDPTFRNRRLHEWATFAQKKYAARPGYAPFISNLPAVFALLLGVLMIRYLRRHRYF